MAEIEVRIGDACRVTGRLSDVDLSLVMATGRRRVGLPVGEASRRAQCPRAVGSAGRSLGHRQRLLGKLATIGHLSEGLPEPPQGRGQTKGEDPLPGIDRPTHRGSKVGLLGRHAIEPFAVTGRIQLMTHLGREGEIGLGMAPANVGFDAVGRQPVEGEGLDRPQHAEPRPGGAGRCRDDEALVRELEQGIEMITAGLRRADHRVHLLEVEAALEDAEPVKHLLAIGREEVVAPGDRAFERPLARGCVARSASGQRQTRREAVADDGRRQCCDPRGRQLDAERQVIEQVTDLGDDSASVGPRLPPDADGAGAVGEQLGAPLDQWRDRDTRARRRCEEVRGW